MYVLIVAAVYVCVTWYPPYVATRMLESIRRMPISMYNVVLG